MKRIIALGLAVSMAIGLTGCSSSTTGGKETTAASKETKAANHETGDADSKTAFPKMNIDLATVYDAKSAPALGAARFKELIEDKSSGAIKINIFTNGSLGTEKDNFTALAADEIPMVVGGIQPIDMYAPEYQFLSAPYMIKDWDHLDAVLGSEIGEGLYKKLDENNIHALAMNRRGIRETTANKEIKTPADLKNIKFRVSEITSWVAFWKGVGALTTSVALTELYSALQTNVVEASEGPYEQFATNKLYEVQKYVINTHHIYEPTWIYISRKQYDAMDEETKALFQECADQAMEYANEQAEILSGQFLQEMVDNGCTVVEPDVDAFRAAAEPVLKDLFETMWTVTTYDEVMGYAE